MIKYDNSKPTLSGYKKLYESTGWASSASVSDEVLQPETCYHYPKRRTEGCAARSRSYENMRNAIGLLKLISQGEADIRCGRTKPQEKMFNEIEEALNKRLK